MTPATMTPRSRRRWSLPTTRASPSASAKSARHGKLRGIGFSDLYRSLRHRAVAGGRLARRRRRLVGIGRSARQSDRLGRSPHRLAQPRPGPRDDLRAARLRAARHSDRQCLDRAWRHRQGAVRHGHLRLALRRGRHVGDRQGARQDRGQGQEGRRRICSKRPKATSSSRTASSPSPAPTSRSAWGDVALQRLHRPQIHRPGARAGPEGGRVLRSDQLHLPGRLPHLRGRDRSGDRQHRDRRLDRGRRFRRRHQSDDRRRPGARRHRPGRRPGAAARARSTTRTASS